MRGVVAVVGLSLLLLHLVHRDSVIDLCLNQPHASVVHDGFHFSRGHWLELAGSFRLPLYRCVGFLKHALGPLVLGVYGRLGRILGELVVRSAHVCLLGLFVLGEVGLVSEEFGRALLLPLFVDEHGQSAGEVRELKVRSDFVNSGLLRLSEKLFHASNHNCLFN